MPMSLPMLVPTLRLATRDDARTIALLSRDRIETGLGWSWTPNRVRRSIADAETQVVVAHVAGLTIGFGIMSFGNEDAHLALLAVRAASGRQGVGTALLHWLEHSARVAGIARIGLEARVTNLAARAFYARHGYRERETLAGYYQGREACVRLGKALRIDSAAPA